MTTVTLPQGISGATIGSVEIPGYSETTLLQVQGLEGPLLRQVLLWIYQDIEERASLLEGRNLAQERFVVAWYHQSEGQIAAWAWLDRNGQHRASWIASNTVVPEAIREPIRSLLRVYVQGASDRPVDREDVCPDDSWGDIGRWW